jgi:hypothetical protein
VAPTVDSIEIDVPAEVAWEFVSDPRRVLRGMKRAIEDSYRSQVLSEDSPGR